MVTLPWAGPATRTPLSQLPSVGSGSVSLAVSPLAAATLRTLSWVTLYESPIAVGAMSLSE